MVGRVSRWRSPWWPVGVAAVAVLLTTWAGSPPGGYFAVALFAFLAWAVVGIAWLTVIGFAVVALPRPVRAHVRRLWPFLVVPALAVATWTAAHTGAIGWAAFEVHRPGLSALVEEVATAPDRRLSDRRVGLHVVRTTALDEATGCTLMTVDDAGFLDARGYAYCPDRVPVDAGGDGLRYQPLDGPWYEFTFVW